MRRPRPPAPGQVRVHRALRTRATYRVLSCDDEHVLVEVVEAPGLDPGAQFRFLAEDVAAMELSEEPPPAADPPR